MRVCHLWRLRFEQFVSAIAIAAIPLCFEADRRHISPGRASSRLRGTRLCRSSRLVLGGGLSRQHPARRDETRIRWGFLKAPATPQVPKQQVHECVTAHYVRPPVTLVSSDRISQPPVCFAGNGAHQWVQETSIQQGNVPNPPSEGQDELRGISRPSQMVIALWLSCD